MKMYKKALEFISQGVSFHAINTGERAADNWVAQM